MVSHIPPNKPGQPAQRPTDVLDVELLRVLVSRSGKQVNAQWAIHPQLKNDLQPTEWKEIVDLMAKITKIVGTRFSEVLSQTEPDPPGIA